MKITISPLGKDYYISNNYFNDIDTALKDYIDFTKNDNKKSNCLVCIIKDKEIIARKTCYLDYRKLYFL